MSHKHDPARAGLEGGLCASQRVIAIGLVAVEEMLAIEQDLAALFARRRDALANAREVLFRGALQRHVNVVIPCLGDEADRIRIRFEQGRDAGIVGGGAPCPLGHAEGAELAR